MSSSRRKRKADAILTSDMHLRTTTPECRLDDYWQAQADCVKFLADLQREHDCPVIDAADMFHTSKPGEFLLQWAIKNLADNIITVPGNHDVANHNMALYDKSGLAVLEAAGKIKVLKGMRAGWNFGDLQVTGYPYGEPFEKAPPMLIGAKRSIAVVHTYVAENIPPFIADGWTPSQLLAELKGFDLIVSGHNHRSLVYENRGRLVVNPGGMMQMSADEIDREPGLYLWYADDNSVEFVAFPRVPGAVSREHIESREERDGRMEAFVQRLNSDVELSLSFEKNMERFLAANKVDQETKDLIWEVIGG